MRRLTGFAFVLALGLVCTAGPALASWSPTSPLLACGAAGQQVMPSMASDGTGGFLLAWFDSRNGGWEIYAQHVLASGDVDPAWTAANGDADGTLLRHAVESEQAWYLTSIVPDGAGGAIVAWSDYRSGAATGDIYAQHVLASGVVDPAWTAANGNADGTPLCAAAGDQCLPMLVTDDAGGAIATWSDRRDGIANVYAQRVLAAGVVDPAWVAAAGNPDGVRLCRAGGTQANPRLVSDLAGGAIVVWFDTRSYQNSGLYAQHVLASGSLDPAWTLLNGNSDGSRISKDWHVESPLAVLTDRAGGLLVAWESSANIAAQHLLASGQVDPAWPWPAGAILCSADSRQNEPVIAEDRAGGAIVAWQDYRRGTDVDIYAQHVLANGSVDPAWTQANGNAQGTAICHQLGAQYFPKIAADGSGGALVAWTDYRTTGQPARVYAQHVVSSGVLDPQWTTQDSNGVAVPGAYDSSDPVILSADPGRAYIAWDAPRTEASGWDILAQRVGEAYAGVLPPTADFVADRTSGEGSLLVHFTDRSIPGGSPILTWTWSFGDGATSTLRNPSHLYLGGCPGTHSVRLVVHSATSADSLTRPDYIVVPGPPDTTSLASPANSAVLVPPATTLRWHPAGCAQWYELLVATDARFDSVVTYSPQVQDTAYPVSLAPGRKYWWRVRAGSSLGLGVCRQVWTFNTAGPLPATPVLVAPADGEVGVPTTVTFRWHRAEWATAYRLQLATNPAFTGSASYSGSDTTRTRDLAEYTDWWWRVAGVNASGEGTISPAWHLRTGAAPPPAPVRRYPLLSTYVYTTAVTLRWSPSAGASSYGVQVSRNPYFSPTVTDQAGLADTLFVANLPGPGVYYWRVNATGPSGTSKYSAGDIWFTVFTTAPGRPVLTEPEDGVLDVSTTPRLVWQAAEGSETFRLQISTRPDFSILFLDDAEAWPGDPVELKEVTHYYWRVRASNPIGSSAFSDAWSFTTGRREVRGRESPPRIPADDNTGPGGVGTPGGSADPPAFALQGVSPNPVRGVPALAFSLPDEAPATLRLFDIAGRQVLPAWTGTWGAGRHTLPLAGVAGLPNGLYVLQMVQAGHAASLRVVILN
jgi:PKD repeat protein